MKLKTTAMKLVSAVVALALSSWIALPRRALAQAPTTTQPAPLVVEETVVDGGLLGGGITLLVVGGLGVGSGLFAGLLTIAAMFGSGGDFEGLGIFTLSALGGGLLALVPGIVMVANSRSTRTVPLSAQGPSVALVPSITHHGGGLALAGTF